MRRPVLALAMALAAALPSCKRGSRGGTPSPSPTPGPAPVLSYLEPSANRCAWVKHDPAAGTRTVLAILPVACEGVRIAWSHDGAKALLWVEPGDGSEPGLFEVRASGETIARTLPPLGSARDLGFDAAGHALVLTLEAIPAVQARQGFVLVDAKRLVVPREMDGLPVLAHAWRDDGSGWKRVETKVSDDAWDLATGVRALDAWRELGPRAWEVLAALPKGAPVGEAVAKTLDAGCGVTRTDDATAWQRLDTPSEKPLHVLVEESDYAVVLPPVCVLHGETASALPDAALDENDSLAPQLRAHWLLVADSSGARPHLYDLRTRTLVWKSGEATGAVFWP